MAFLSEIELATLGSVFPGGSLPEVGVRLAGQDVFFVPVFAYDPALEPERQKIVAAIVSDSLETVDESAGMLCPSLAQLRAGIIGKSVQAMLAFVRANPVPALSVPSIRGTR